MINEIISVLYFIKLLLLKSERFGHFWVFSLFLSISSNYFLVKDLFHLYYTIKLKDARKHLLTKRKTILMIHIFINLSFTGVNLYAVPQEIALLFFSFSVIFLHRLFYKLSLAETENLIFDNNFSLGYGAALCYYENYFKYILREPKLNLKSRIRMFKSLQNISNMSEKLFILIPYSCKIETYIDEFEDINRCKELIPFEKNIAGIPKRNYNITVYHITCDAKPHKWVRLALEYAQPIKDLFSFKERGLLSLKDMYKQRKIFVECLRKMLSESKNSKEIHLVEYDDELPSYELSEVLMNVEAVYEYKQYKDT